MTTNQYIVAALHRNATKSHHRPKIRQQEDIVTINIVLLSHPSSLCQVCISVCVCVCVWVCVRACTANFLLSLQTPQPYVSARQMCKPDVSAPGGKELQTDLPYLSVFLVLQCLQRPQFESTMSQRAVVRHISFRGKNSNTRPSASPFLESGRVF